MNLIEIRNLVFNFMKQFTAQDLKLLMNFLEVSVTDYERDPIKYYETLKQFGPEETSIKFSITPSVSLSELSSRNSISSNLNLQVQNENESERIRKNSLDTGTPDRSTDSSNGYQSFNEQEFNDNEDDDDDDGEVKEYENYEETEQDIKSDYSFPQTTQHSLPKYHTAYLNQKYSENVYPTSEQKKQIALETNLTELQINQWFNAKRAKLKQTKPRHVPRFSVETVVYLHREYANNKYPSIEDRNRIALEANISVKQVQTWFINQRNKK